MTLDMDWPAWNSRQTWNAFFLDLLFIAFAVHFKQWMWNLSELHISYKVFFQFCSMPSYQPPPSGTEQHRRSTCLLGPCSYCDPSTLLSHLSECRRRNFKVAEPLQLFKRLLRTNIRPSGGLNILYIHYI